MPKLMRKMFMTVQPVNTWDMPHEILHDEEMPRTGEKVRYIGDNRELLGRLGQVVDDIVINGLIVVRFGHEKEYDIWHVHPLDVKVVP